MRGAEDCFHADCVRRETYQNPQMQQRCYTQSIQPGGHIIEDDAPAFGQPFKLADGKGLGDVEKAKQNQRNQRVAPVGEAAKQRDPLAGHFVDDHKAGILATALLARQSSRRGRREPAPRRCPRAARSAIARGRRMKRPRRKRPKAARRRLSPKCRGRACRGPRRKTWRRSRPSRVLCAVVAWCWQRSYSSSESSPLAAAHFAEVFQHFGVEHGRADLVDAHGPLAQVNLAAAVAAERKVLVAVIGPACRRWGSGAVLTDFFLVAIELIPLYTGPLQRAETMRATTSYSWASVISAR